MFVIVLILACAEMSLCPGYVKCIQLLSTSCVYVVTWCRNSYIFSSKVGKSIFCGRNLYTVAHSLDFSCINIGADAIKAVGLFIKGRISGDMMIRCLPLDNALCVRATVNSLLRIKDIGYISLCHLDGVVGVTVGRIS